MKSFIALSGWVLMVSAFFCTGVFAQDPTIQFARVVDQPLPAYPEAARKTGLSGRVHVLVTVDTDGNLTAINDVTGPLWICPQVTTPDVVALRLAATAAARKARFRPEITNGIPAVSTIWVHYDFKAPAADSPTNSVRPVESKTDQAAPRGAEKDTLRVAGERYTILGQAKKDKLISDGTPPVYSPVILPNETPAFDSSGNIIGGVMNGKAIKLPKPSYPAAALAIRAAGTVSVQVVIETDGNVFSAEAIDGHALLRSASVAAACQSKFTPTLLSGNPVKVRGVINYNFVP